MFTTNDIRTSFLQFFADKGHKVVPSDSLVPKDDPTVLFTSAGMNQFKPQFMGHITDFTRATSCQKCLRTDDLPEVGKTPYHHSFFEMLGNFSFGDYFKEEAITWAWEYLTNVLKIDPDRLWVSVHKDDEEAFKIWSEKIKIPQERISKLGDKTNFWPSDAIKKGPNGPCGPCSEIFFDQGPVVGFPEHNCGLDCNCGRFAEIWNLVFTQYNREANGVLTPLPQRNIDTGMGLERISAVMQGKKSNFEIDIFYPIVEKILSVTGQELNETNKAFVYTIADHIRAIVFAITDGVMPSNDGRGYVVRKLIRKAIWHGRSLGCKGIFLFELVPVVVSTMGSVYPELIERASVVGQLVKSEEDRFLHTLELGLNLISEEIEKVKKRKENVLPGEVCFLLYDTYGFPIEMSREIAEKNGLSVDEKGFQYLMEHQRERSKASSSTVENIFIHSNICKYGKDSCFVGYDLLEAETEIAAILSDNNLQQEAKAGEMVEIVLKECPFYGEAGGQIGDKGLIIGKENEAEVLATYKAADVRVCSVKVKKGVFKLGESVRAIVDKKRRLSVARNHTATHLLQAALRKVLGTHVSQAGSYVGEDKLRFDFTHFEAIDKSKLREIEFLVNSWIIKNIFVEKIETTFNKAKQMGALAFFGEKYGERVRVIRIGDLSCELCGGTHVDYTGEIGSFMITNERSISAGVRRIEAITGEVAFKYSAKLKDVVSSIKFILKTEVEFLPKIVSEILQRNKELEKENKELNSKLLLQSTQEQLRPVKEIGQAKIIANIFENMEMAMLREIWDGMKTRPEKLVALLVGSKKDKVYMILACSKPLLARGCDMRLFLNELKSILPVSGGGRRDFVQVGGKCSLRELKAQWEKVLNKLERWLSEL